MTKSMNISQSMFARQGPTCSLAFNTRNDHFHALSSETVMSPNFTPSSKSQTPYLLLSHFPTLDLLAAQSRRLQDVPKALLVEVR